MTRVLALDLAQAVGWCSDMPSGGPVPCMGNFRVDADGGEAVGRALYDFRRSLNDLVTLHAPTDIAVEAPLPEKAHGMWFGELVWGMVGQVHLLGFDRGLEIWSCDIKAVRKHFIGNGASRKEAKQDVWARCLQLGWRPKTLDESDAAACWDYAHSTLRSAQVMARAR